MFRRSMTIAVGLTLLLMAIVVFPLLPGYLAYGGSTVVTYVVALDGSGNFTDIQEAISAVPLSSQGLIIVKKGIYDLNPALKYPFKSIVVRSNLTITGEGIDKTIVRSFPTIQPAGSSIRAMTITSTSDIQNLVIENLTVIQNGTPDNMGWNAIDLRGGSNKDIIMRRIKVTDSTGSAISIQRYNNLTVEECTTERSYTGINLIGGAKGLVKTCRVLNTSGDSIFLQPLTSFNISATDVTLDGNYVENAGDTGIDITSLNGVPPNDRILLKANYIKNAHIRISNSQNVTIISNTLENGFVNVDAGQVKPTNITVKGNTITTSTKVAIGFYGSRDCSAINNKIYFVGSVAGKSQAGISAGIWGTGLIEGNTVVNSSNYGIDFASWGTGGQSRITIRNNTLVDFKDIGVYDNAKSCGPVVVENNTIWDTRSPFVSRYGIRTDYVYNVWTIRYNRVYAGSIAAISAPKSTLYGNIYEPPVQEWPPSDFINSTSVTAGEKAEVDSTRVYSGSRSAKFSSDGLTDREYAYWHSHLTSTNDVWCDGYVNVQTSGINVTEDRFFFFRLRSQNPANDLAFGGWRNYGGKVLWCIIIRDGTNYVAAYSTGSPQLNRWYHVEIHWVGNSTNGYGELYVDGILVATTMLRNSHANTSYLGQCNEIRFGLAELVSCSATIVYCDDFATS